MEGGYIYMLIPAKFYIVVGNSSFFIRRQDSDIRTEIHLETFAPYIPPYHHLFDENKCAYLLDITSQIKKLKIKNATIILPDDVVDVAVERKMLTGFFSENGVSKIQVNHQCFLLNLDNKKYISISKTSRTIVMHYIAYREALATRYYDIGNTNIEEITQDLKNIHIQCKCNDVPVFINNIDENMDEYSSLGTLVSLDDIFTNAMNHKYSYL